MHKEQQAWIVSAMSAPGFYDHPVDVVELIETHISWVFLAGKFAYKVKKPLDLGFLDFSTLAKRHHYCLEELRLNRQFAEKLYLAVTKIGGSPDAPVINGDPPIEYAVKMRRFPADCQLDGLLEAGRLRARHLVAFAERIAALHGYAEPAAADTPYGSPEAVIAPVLENFAQLGPLVQGRAGEAQLARLEEWARAACEALAPLIRQRKDGGFVRACHGDVHLANMAWLDDRPLLFDCIEFNENLRWIDIVNDIAFLAMDLDDRSQTELGWLFLNRYLQATGDYQGLQLLNFYKSYRAMVRAKVIGLRLDQDDLDPAERREDERLFHSYLDLAEQYMQPPAATLVITHGLSGSGKSTFAAQLTQRLGAIHLRSDLERKRLHGLPATANSKSPVGGGIYSADAFAVTYARLHELAKAVLCSGLTVIVDATFIKSEQRKLFHDLAKSLQVPMTILDFPLADAELRRRLTERTAGAKDASEADVAVLEYQYDHAEALTAAERQNVVIIYPDTDVEEVVERLRCR